ncbi:MAG: hypothetical protein ACTSQY_10105 [Candidatus Odinarchaeia archaeon]
MILNKNKDLGRINKPYDIAQKLGEKGINKILKMVCRAYNMLLKNKRINVKMSEDEITEELYTEIIIVWSQSGIQNLLPINQKIDKTLAKNRGKPPTIDFCFRDRWIKKAFFGFECKILAEGNSRLTKEYVDNGLKRYLQGKYCSTTSIGSLIGYVIIGDIKKTIQDVKKRVDKESIIKKMTLASSILDFKNHFTSEHSRVRGLSNFKVHHLFMYFVLDEKK